MFLFSCTKKEVSSPVINTYTPRDTVYTISDYTKLSVGNYWVYQVVNVDTLGNVTVQGTDSCYIKNDTTIRGNIYFHMVNAPFNIYTLVRDSSSCMINQYGNIQFTLGYLNTALVEDSTAQVTTIYSVPDAPMGITVPMGTYYCFDYMGISTIYTQGYKWGRTRYSDNYYSPGMGLVEASTYNINQPGTIQCRLIRAHIK